MRTLLLAVSLALQRLVNRIGRFAAWLALALAGIILFDVVTRRFFVLGSTKLQEMEWHLHTALFMLCLGYAYLQDAHVRINLVRDRLGARAKAWVEVAGLLVFLLPYSAMIVYYAWDFVGRSWAIGEVSAALTGLPHRWAIKAMVPIGFGLLFLAGLAALLDRLAFLLGPSGGGPPAPGAPPPEPTR